MKKTTTLLIALLTLINVNSYSQSTLILQPNSVDGKDAFVNSFSTHQNLDFSSNQQFPAHAGTSGGVGFFTRGYMQFDLSTIPPGMKIDSAFISLFAVTQNLGLGMHRNSSGPNGAWLRRVTSTWSDSTINWNNVPTVTTVNQIALAPSTNQTQDYLDIDVSVLIQDIYQNQSNNGFQFILQDENYFRSLIFYSSNTSDSTKRPKLEVHYSPDTTKSIIIKPADAIGKDAIIHELTSQRNSNFGTNDQFSAHAGTFSGTPFIVRGLIDFDLSVIPTGMKVDSALLSLYAYDIPNSGFGLHRNSSGPNGAWLRRITSAWDEMTVTWNNAPTTTTVNQVALNPSINPIQHYQNINITPLIQDILTNPTTSFGFQFILQNENFYRTLNFYSSDASNSAYHPELKIFYSPISTLISKISKEIKTFTISPNPSNGFIKLDLKSSETFYQISIIDINGKTVRVIENYKNLHPIKTNTLAPGIYFIKLNSNNSKVEFQKFIVQ